MNWLRRLLGQHPKHFSESRYVIDRGCLPIDRVFLWVDLGFSALALIQLALNLSGVLAATLLVRLARIGFVAFLLGQSSRQAPNRFGYRGFSICAVLETAVMSAGYLWVGAPLSQDEALFAHAMPLAAMLSVHPLDMFARVWVIAVSVVSYAIWLAKQWSSLPDPTLGLYGLIVLLCIVGASSLLERQRRESSQRARVLRRSINDKNRALRRARDETELKNEQLRASIHWQRDALATNVARSIVHELAQPIAAASNAAYLLRKQVEPANKDLKLLQSNLERARKSIVDYRSFFLRPADEIGPARCRCAAPLRKPSIWSVITSDRVWSLIWHFQVIITWPSSNWRLPGVGELV